MSQKSVEELNPDLEKRLAIAKNVKEWDSAGKKPGLEIFRIEKLQVKRIPDAQHGQFYDGDAYIILHTRAGVQNDFGYDIHYWLGNNCSIDERTVAAYKTVELDDHFETKATQYRETQGYESEKFLSYFPKGMRVLKGGIESGFKKVVPCEKDPRLIQFKGRKVVQSVEVKALASSLNQGDAFVLEAGKNIYVWKGDAAGQMEKFGASQYAEQVKNEDNATLVVLDSHGSDEFWKLLKGSFKDVKSAKEGGDDSISIKKSILHKISDESGTVQFVKIADGNNVTMDKFNTNDAFLFDSGTALFVWIGAKASAAEKRSSMNKAMQYIKTNNLSNSLPVERIFEGQETTAFKNALKQK